MVEAVVLWNEPNNLSHWNFHLDPQWNLFADMVKQAATAIRRVNPELKIVLGGVSSCDCDFLRNMTRQGVMEYIDVVAVHGFPLDWNHWELSEWPERIAEAEAVTGRPVWVTEVGASSFGAQEVQRFGFNRTLELLRGRTDRIHWYSLFDLPPSWPAETRHKEAEGSSYYRHYYLGLIDADGKPKLAAADFPADGSVGFCQWFHFEDPRLEDAVEWMQQHRVHYLRTGLSWADSFRPNATEWFDRQMEALSSFRVALTLCFTPAHLGLEEHHTSPPQENRQFAEFAAQMVARYAPASKIDLQLQEAPPKRMKIPSKSRQVLITGGAGFVGSHLADGLLAAGHRVRVLDDLTPQVHQNGAPDYLSSQVELVVGDVRDPNRLREVLAGIDIIFHFAATVGVGQSMYEIARYISVNTQGTAELLQAMLDNHISPEKLIVASSMSIYGEGQYQCSQCGEAAFPPVRPVSQLKAGVWEIHCKLCRGVLLPVPTAESKPSEINSVYALSKRDQEELCLIYGRTYGIPVTALRFYNIYGTRQALSNPYTGVAAIFASRLINNQNPLVFEDGEQMRDFVSVHDIVRANLLAMDAPASNDQVINIGGGVPISIRRVAEILAKALGKPELTPIITQRYRAGDIRHCFADLARARKLLGYEPQITHEQGFRELAAWLADQQAEDKAETMLQELSTYGLTA